MFRSKQTNNDQRELIILVTPKVLDDDTTINNKKYDLEFSSEDANNLYKDLNLNKVPAFKIFKFIHYLM